MVKMPASFLFLLLPFLLLRLIFWFSTFPNPDEAYYWLWGQHPALSYYDHPPLLAWVQAGFTATLGRSLLTLRLPNLFSNAVLFFTYYRITRYLYGEKADSAFWMVVLLVLSSPLYFLFLALAWHDHLLIAFSLASAFLFITFLDSYRLDSYGREGDRPDRLDRPDHIDRPGETWRLYSAALLLGLAALCKYNAVFVGGGFVAAVIANPPLRSLGRDQRVYLAVAIAGLALIPIGLWNLSNDWQSFRYYVDRSVATGSFHFNPWPCLGFLIFSILTVSPFHCLSFRRAWKLGFPGIQAQSFYGSVAGWIFAISTVSLTAISLVSAALYYWNITAYLLLFPLLPAAFFDRRPDRPQLFWGGQCYGLLFATLLVVHYSLVPISAWVSREGDPDSRMLFGWNQVAQEVRAEAEKLGPATLEPPLLITTDYRSASALAYELNDKTVIAISDRVDQFDFWTPDDRAIVGNNAVLLSDDWHPLTPQLLSRFDRTSPPVTVAVDRFGVWIKNYYVRRGYGFKEGRREKRLGGGGAEGAEGQRERRFVQLLPPSPLAP